MTAREVALDYASKGWPVIRLRPQTNVPYGHSADAPTADLAVVEARWTAVPDANIGFVPAGKLIVLDVDAKNGGTASPDWPVTLTARTPSGGTHHYFAHPGEPIKGSIGKLERAVDVIADGGSPWQVAVPPSIRPDGAYEWLNAGTPIAPLSCALLDQLRAIQRPGSGVAPPVELVAPGDMYEHLLDRAIRAVRAGMTDEDELNDFLAVLFEHRRVPGAQYGGGPKDTEKIAKWAADSNIAADIRDAS